MATGLPQILSVAEGGTGAKTAPAATVNLGLGKLSVSSPTYGLVLDTIGNTADRELIIPDSDGTINVTITKTTTGNPSLTVESVMCINTFDKNIKIYADGEWRQIATWA